MINKLIIGLLATALIIITGCSQSTNYNLIGNSVVIDDNYLFMNVTPHTIHSSQWVELDFESKLFTGDIDFAFGFDTDNVYPTKAQRYFIHDEVNSYTCNYDFIYTTNPNYFKCYYSVEATGNTTAHNVTVFEHSFLTGNPETKTAYWNETLEWVDWNPTESVNYNYDGMNKWYYAKNQIIKANQIYKIRYYLEIPVDGNGKYALAIKPSSETIQQAVENNHFWYLDPWYIYELNTNMYLYYSFNNDSFDETSSNFTDLVSNTNLHLFNNVSWGVAGKNYEAIVWNVTGDAGGGDYNNYKATVDDNVSLGDSFTICYWFKQPTWSGIHDTGTVFTRDEVGTLCSNTHADYLPHCVLSEISRDVDAISFFVSNGTTGDGVSVLRNMNFKDNSWHFVCNRFNGTDVSIFYNGTSASNSTPLTISGTYLSNSYYSNFGRRSVDDDNGVVNETIDEFSFWNRSLTEDEMNNLFNAGNGIFYTSSGQFISGLAITPATAYADDTLNCSALIYNNYGIDMEGNITWTKDGVNQPSYDYIYTNIANGTIIDSTISMVNLGIGSNWTCSLYAQYVDDPTNYSSGSVSRTITGLSLDNCTTNPDLIFNISLRDEATNTEINQSDLSTYIHLDIILSSLTNPDISIANYSVKLTDINQTAVCIEDNVLDSKNFTIDSTIEYYADDHIIKYWFLDNGTLSLSNNFNNYTTKTINLMDLLSADSTTFLFRYYDENGLADPDAEVITYRKYVGEGIYREVERSIQDESGDTQVHLVEEDVIYYFRIVKGDNILFTSQAFQVKCLSIPCTLELQASSDYIPFSTDWDLVSDGAYSLSSDKSNRNVILTFDTTSASNWTLQIYKYSNTPSEAVLVNTSSLTSTSGSVTSHIPQSAGNITYVARILRNGTYIRDSFVSFSGSQLGTFRTAGGFILGALIGIAIVLVFATEGVAVVFGVIIGIVTIGLLKLINLDWEAFIFIFLMGGIIIYKLTKK